MWNEKDPFLKERLFGLTGHEGNHGEDGKLINIPSFPFFVSRRNKY